MIREPNITNFETFRRSNHNPLFNVLTDDFDNMFLEKNIDDKFIIENLYVEARSKESVTNERLFTLWSSRPTVVASVDDFIKKIDSHPGMVYMLLGKKGIGKTLLLRYFFYQMILHHKYLSSKDNIIITLDLKNKKDDEQFLNSLPSSLMDEIFYYLKRRDNYMGKYLEIPDKIREIDQNYYYIRDDSDLSKRVLDNKEEALQFLFAWANRNNIGIHLIVDNIDDFSVIAIKKIIYKCIEFKEKFSARCIIGLRDYWHPRNIKIDDSNICSCNLGKPDIYKIFQKRLNSINVQNITNKLSIKYSNRKITFDANDFIKTFDEIARELVLNQKELHNFLYQLCNYNTREHLRNLYYFFHSPYLYSRPNFIQSITNKLQSIDPEFYPGSLRPIRYFDFIECLMGVHSLCYDIEASQIFNVFFHDWHYEAGYHYKNTLIFVRILQIVSSKPLNKEHIIATLKSISYEEGAVRNALDILLDKALLESIGGIKEKDATEIWLSGKGIIYKEKLIYEYSYLVFICDAIPMERKYKTDLMEKFGTEEIPLERGNLTLKHESVRKLIEFIKHEETIERRACQNQYIPVLERIVGEEQLSYLMTYETEKTMDNMLRYGLRKVKKITEVELI